MQLKIIQGKSCKELQEAVNSFLDGKPNSEMLDQAVLYPPNPGDPYLAILWLRSTQNLEEPS